MPVYNAAYVPGYGAPIWIQLRIIAISSADSLALWCEPSSIFISGLAESPTPRGLLLPDPLRPSETNPVVVSVMKL